MAISVDNLWIFSASHDDVLLMYSLEEMQSIRTITVAPAQTEDGNVNSEDDDEEEEDIYESFMETAKKATTTASSSALSCCYPLPNNRTVLLGTEDSQGTVCTYSIEQEEVSKPYQAHG